ncbi:T9SS type A sorting domain-containing protein [Phaeocystidibacter luteus]|uniref:T9SS type A sorting domain-containing protein n=2 Tax=Phaeocystidibacter luteus TaxID=911197 RepID=A0A6N6RMS4_9FLAO|nr:T9SS type A sorting domain-containing protein [Phaeocystidibacter luteus]
MCHFYPSLKRILTMVTVTLLSVFSLDGYAQRTGGTPDAGAFAFGVPAPIAQCIAVTVPADANCQAFVSPQAINDNSYASGTTVSLSMSPSGPFPIGTHTVTLTVARDDRPDMTASCTTTITVTDQTGPAITPVNPTIALDANGQASITASDVTSSIIDNCDPNPTTTLSKTTFDCTDLANNIGNAQPGSISGTLTADNLFEWYISTDDNVQGTLVGTGSNWTVVYNYMENLPAGQTYYIHVKATDVGGPEFFCGKFNLTGGFVFANGTQSLNTNAAEWKVSTTGWNNYTTPYFVGNVGFQPWGFTISSLSPAQLIWEGNWNTVGGETRYFSAPIYPVIPGTNVTITSTDNVGNQTVFTANVILEDNIDPIAVANSLTLSLDNTGNATITAADIDGGSTDNCGIHSMSIDRTSFSCADAGQSFPVTLTVSDISGNTSTASATVTVSSLPTIVAVPDIFNNVNSGQPFTFNASSLLANDSDPLGQNLQVDAVINPSAGTIVDNFDGTYTFNAPSGGAQTVTADYIVKRDDGTILFTDNGHFYEFVSAPGITWSSAKSQAEGRYYNGMQGYLVTVTSASEDAFVQQKLQGEGWIGASDEETELTWKWVTGPEAGTVFWNQATQTPVNGQYANWSQGEPNDFKYGNPFHPGEDWGHYYSNGVWNDFPNSAGSIAGYIVEYGGMPGDCTPNSTAQAGITFNVIDATPPTVVTQNITVNLDANGQVSILPSDVDNGSSDPSGIASLSLDVSSFDCSNLGTNTVTLTVTDNNGQSATGTAIVSVTDLIAPTAAVNNFTVQLDVTGTATISVSDIDAGSSDNCAIVSSSLSRTTFNCNDGGNVVPVTLTVLDASGNIGSAIANVTVQDVQPVTANADVFNVNTGQSLVISEADLIANDVDPYGQVLQVDAVSNPSSGTIVDNLNGTWTFTPNGTSNQTVTASYTVKRDDGTIVFADNGHFYEFVSAPGITWTNAKIAAEQLTYNGMQGYLVTVTSANENAFVTQKLQGQGWMGATDAETEDLWKWVTGPEAGTAFFQRSLVFSGFSAFYTYTPLNGLYNNWGGSEPNNLGGEDYAHFLTNGFWNDYPNSVGGLISGYIVEYGGMPGDCNTASSSNGAITINVIDATPPTVLTQNITISLDANGNASIVPADVDNGTNDASGIASLSLDISSFNCSNVGANTVTLTAVDNNGVSASGTAQVTVTAPLPVLAFDASTTVYLDGSGSASVTPADINASYTSVCGGNGVVTLSQSTFGCNEVGQNTVTVSAGSSTGILVVNVVDTLAPVIATQNITAYLDANGSVTIAASDVDNGTADNCQLDGIEISQETFDCNDLGANTITFTAFDNGGGPAGTFSNNIVTSAPTGQGTRYFSADVDGDGDIDMCNGWQILRNNGTGLAFTAQNLGGFGQQGGAFADFDGDGDLDVVTLGKIFLNNGSGVFSFHDDIQSAYPEGGQTGVGDFDEDGDLDIVQALYYTNGNRVLFNDGTGKFDGSDPTKRVVYPAYYSQNVIVADVNNDNHLDFLTTGYNITLYLGDGTGQFTITSYPMPAGNGSSSIAKAFEDYNQDGHLDFITTSGDAYLWEGDGNGNFTQTTTYTNLDDNNGTSIGMGTNLSADMNSDGILDLVIGRFEKLNIAYSNGDGTFSVDEQILPGMNTSYGWQAGTVADFDGDGFNDLALNPFNFGCCGSAYMYLQDKSDPNTSTASVTVTIADTISPSITFAGGNFNLDANQAVNLSPADLTGSLSDNCGTPTVAIIGRTSYNCDDLGQTFALTIEATDASGNVTTASGTITITDDNKVCNQPPVAICNAQSVAADQNCEAGVFAQAFNGGSYDPDGDPITQTITPAGPFGLGTHTVLYTVTDDKGESSSCTTTITVTDQSAPVIATQDITIALDANGQASITPSDVVTSYFDNCSAVTLSLDQTQFDCNSVPAVNGTGGPGTLTGTLTVDNLFEFYISTDDNVQGTFIGSGSNWAIPYTYSTNLAAGQTYYIHVKATDVGGPEMFLGNFNLTGGFQFANGTQNLVTNAADWQVSPTGWNNYTNPLYLGNIGFGPWGFGLFSMSPAQFIWHGSYGTAGGETKYFTAPIYPTATGANVTVTATDAYGNQAQQSVTVNVVDNMAPTASVNNINVVLDANGNASITASDIDNGSSDNCGITSYSLDVSSFTCADAGTSVPVTMTVTDASGNSASATAQVNVIDNSAPNAIVASNIVVALDANGAGNLTVADVDGGSNDNCSIASSSIDVTSFSCADVGTVPVTLTVVDPSGNTSTAVAQVQVVDNINPTVVLASNLTVVLDANGAGSITAADVDGGSSDNCAIASTSIDVSNFSCADVGANAVTLTVVDVNGNSSSATAQVTVIDNTAPTVVLANNIVVALDANGAGSLTAGDVDAGSFDNCGIASTSIDVTSFSCADVGTVPVTLTVIDNNGNMSSATAQVQVVDNINPTAVLASNIVVSLDANGAGSLTVGDVDAGSFDNCAVASTSIDVTSFSCADVGTVPVTLTVTDVNGNTSTATAQVQVVDNIAPTAMCQDIVIDLPEVGNATITASMIDNGSFDNCGIASISVSPSSFDCATEGDNTVTLTVTDVNGNVSTCTSTVTVVKSPIVVTAVQSDYNGFGVSCTGSSDGAIDLTVSGACQPYSFSWSNGSATEDVSGLSVGTYTVIVTDGNGETYSYSYTITEPTPVVASKSMFPYQMVSGQLDSTIFLGYGPQSTTLSVNAGGGVGGYTYAWSPATGLNSTNASSVVASPMQTTTYTCVITDANGCSVSKSITVNVIDARDPNNPNKVVLCHLRRKKTRLTWHTISVSVNAVPAHLGHGDYLGPCDNNSTKIEIEDEHEAHALHAHLFPNPTNATSTLSLEIEDTEEVAINLFDARGALIENIHQGVLTGEYEHEFEISSSGLAPGVYNVVIQTADGMEALRWVIVQ